jgi:hypothetical protein
VKQIVISADSTTTTPPRHLIFEAGARRGSLSAGTVPVTTLRAAMIVGRGAPFETCGLPSELS